MTEETAQWLEELREYGRQLGKDIKKWANVNAPELMPFLNIKFRLKDPDDPWGDIEIVDDSEEWAWLL